MGIRQRISDKALQVTDDMVAQIRAKHFPRWMELTTEFTGRECISPADIDYTEPHIHIEWLLCDPTYLSWVKKAKYRHKWYELLTDEEVTVYLDYVGDDGGKYTDLEKDGMKKSISKALVHRKW